MTSINFINPGHKAVIDLWNDRFISHPKENLDLGLLALRGVDTATPPHGGRLAGDAGAVLAFQTGQATLIGLVKGGNLAGKPTIEMMVKTYGVQLKCFPKQWTNPLIWRNQQGWYNDGQILIRVAYQWHSGTPQRYFPNMKLGACLYWKKQWNITIGTTMMGSVVLA